MNAEIITGVVGETSNGNTLWLFFLGLSLITFFFWMRDKREIKRLKILLKMRFKNKVEVTKLK